MKKHTKVQSSQRYMGLAFVVFLVLLGVKGLIWVYHDTALILDSRNWVVGEGVIDRSWLDRTWNRSTPNYSLMMDYHFSVAGVTYTGDRFEIPSRSSGGDEEFFRKQLAPYSPGSLVKIYYDPKNPTRSVITHPEMNYFFTFFLGGIALLFCAAPSFFVYLFLRKRFVENKIARRAV